MTISNVILRLDIRTEYKHFETQIEQKIKNIEAEQKLFGSNEKKEFILFFILLCKTAKGTDHPMSSALFNVGYGIALK